MARHRTSQPEAGILSVILATPELVQLACEWHLHGAEAHCAGSGLVMSLLLPKVQSVDLCRDHLPKMETLCPECGRASHAGVDMCREWLCFSHGQSMIDIVIGMPE